MSKFLSNTNKLTDQQTETFEEVSESVGSTQLDSSTPLLISELSCLNDESSIQNSELTQGEVYFMCSICRHWSFTRSSLVIHIAEHFHECPTCETCGEAFVQKQDYADHCAEHVGWSCIVCDQTFFEEEDFEDHLLEHRLQCVVCKEKSSSELELQKHYSKHKEVMNLQCEICSKYCSTKHILKTHMQSQHKLQPAATILECKECGLELSRKQCLERHIRTVHEKIKEYGCHLCDKRFSLQTSLATHLLNHAGEKPYTCLVCDRSFADRRGFRKHGLDHLADERIFCKICGRQFSSKSRYKVHMDYHQRPKTFKYKCHICPKAFNYSSHLKKHLASHFGERKQVCEVCSQSLADRWGLRLHLQKKHDYSKQNVIDAMERLKIALRKEND